MAGPTEVAPNDSPPDRQAFWRWVSQVARPYIGWTLLVLGAVAIFLGWYGVSGQSLTAKQLPYLASGGLTGIGLIVIAAMFLVTDDFRRQVGRLGQLERKIDELYSLLVVDPPVATPDVAEQPLESPAPIADTAVVALATGSSYHRPSCSLVAGKANAVKVDAGAIKARSLKPCQVCDPAPPTKRR